MTTYTKVPEVPFKPANQTKDALTNLAMLFNDLIPMLTNAYANTEQEACRKTRTQDHQRGPRTQDHQRGPRTQDHQAGPRTIRGTEDRGPRTQDPGSYVFVKMRSCVPSSTLQSIRNAEVLFVLFESFS